MAEIKKTSNMLNAKEMAKEILKDLETLIPLCIEAHEKTSEVGDLATSDLLISYIKRTEKSQCMLSSFIK